MMSEPSSPGSDELTAYEGEQVRQIAAWKSEPPNPFGELFKRVTLPGAKLAEKVIPDRAVRSTLDAAYNASEALASQGDVKRRAGIQELVEMRRQPLEACDRLATRVGKTSQVIAAAEGAATGAGGALTTLADVPLLFILALRTILKVGHCYGYTLDRPRDRPYVLGVLLAATSGSLETRRQRLDQLHEIEDWLLEETQQDVAAQEIASLLFQLEVFGDVPGVGAASGAVLNLAFIRRVDVTARRVFQERWLKDNGRVDTIAPDQVSAYALAAGWSGAWSRAAYSGCYYLGFGATLPVWFFATAPPTLRERLDARSPRRRRRGRRPGSSAPLRGETPSHRACVGPARRGVRFPISSRGGLDDGIGTSLSLQPVSAIDSGRGGK